MLWVTCGNATNSHLASNLQSSAFGCFAALGAGRDFDTNRR
ncbi:MAG: hypothetical protein ACRD8U_19395 [Pyrinomonadaceae bacterium]